MIISCDECGTTFELDRKYVKPGGTKVRCARCKSVFRVYPEGDGETGPKPAPPSPTATPPDPPTAPAAASSAAESDFDSPTLRRTPTPPMNKTRSESAPSPTAVPPATSAPRPETGADADEKAKAERSGSQRYVSFRKRLMYFAGVIIGFIALVVVPIELHRPYEELDRLIQNARSLIAGVRSGIPGDEMIRMNRFALETIADPQIGAVEGRENYFYLSFNLLITDGEIPPAADVFQRMEDFGAFGGRENFRYEWLRETADYWEARFAAA
ncbi:MAG: zinc-ribbon domain-containing protein, partial [Desulfococcaceae bacterium]